ncbi:hypothetical protein NDU88_010697, partial [Pleurodeles waltl]
EFQFIRVRAGGLLEATSHTWVWPGSPSDAPSHAVASNTPAFTVLPANQAFQTLAQNLPGPGGGFCGQVWCFQDARRCRGPVLRMVGGDFCGQVWCFQDARRCRGPGLQMVGGGFCAQVWCFQDARRCRGPGLRMVGRNGARCGRPVGVGEASSGSRAIFAFIAADFAPLPGFQPEVQERR